MTEDTRKFWTATEGEITLAQVYKWIRRMAKGVDALFFDPVFDMLQPGQSVDVNWVTRDGLYCMKSIKRVA